MKNDTIVFVDENYKKIVSSMPNKLLQKEENLYSAFSKMKVSPLKQLGLLYKFMDELELMSNVGDEKLSRLL